MQSQTMSSLCGLSFPYNVNLAAAAPFMDIAGFPLIYACSPGTTMTDPSADGQRGPRTGHSHPTAAVSHVPTVESGSPGQRTPPVSASPSFPPCRLPYPSSPAESASLASASSPPYVRTRTLTASGRESAASPGTRRLDGCRLPRPFTIEAILGLESQRCLDDSLDTDGHLDYNGKLRIRQIGPLIGNRFAATNHLRHSYDRPNVGHKRINITGKECRRNFGHSNSNVSHPTEKPMKSKRVRTIFTPEQLERLESEFERQQYMVGPERLYLAASLNLTEAQVKVWFQNRRIKWRKQHLELQQARLAKIRCDGAPGDDYTEEDYCDESSDEDIQ